MEERERVNWPQWIGEERERVKRGEEVDEEEEQREGLTS